MGANARTLARWGPGCGGAAITGPPEHWPALLWRAGLLSTSPSAGTALPLDALLYRLYGMYLVVLAARYAHTRSGALGRGEAPFPHKPAPGGKGGYPWQDLCGPLPLLLEVPAMQGSPGVSS